MKKTVSYPEKWLKRIDREATFSTENGLSGAVLSIALDGRNILQKKYGYQRKYDQYQLMPEFEPMRIDTIFDLASLTKIFSTTLAFMILVDHKEVSINDKVKHYLKDFTNDKVTIKHLLGHNSGLPADFHFLTPHWYRRSFIHNQDSELLSLLQKCRSSAHQKARRFIVMLALSHSASSWKKSPACARISSWKNRFTRHSG